MSQFFALLSRMKYIQRWSLMRNTRLENLSEHSLEVSIIAHLLALLKNQRFGGSVSAERAAVLALFHDASEILTGDLPTPVKYVNRNLRTAYHQVEEEARERLLQNLPMDLRDSYRDLLLPSAEEEELWILVKAADKLSALIKCIEERKMGNTEFLQAEQAQIEAIRAMKLPEADCFLAEFLPAFQLTLDHLQQQE